MKKLQQDFFFLIKQRIPSYENMAQNIAQILGLSINESYKKINGNSPISLNHILKLCNYYNIQFVYSPNEIRTVNFTFPDLRKETENMEAHLNRIINHMNMILCAKKKHVMLATDDIPFFYLFRHRELSLFKLSYWQSSLSEQTVNFTAEHDDEKLCQLTRKIHDLYLEIPTTEVWSKNVLLGTIDQIRYAFDAGVITSKALAIRLVEQLMDVLEVIRAYAINGKKTIDDGHSFEWFQCDVVGNVTFLVKIENSKICLNRFNTFNYMETIDDLFCEETENWISKLIGKSTCFSGHGEKYRNRFINDSLQSCVELIKYIEKQC